jgi:hypothetical protein
VIQPGDAAAIRVLVESLPSNRSDCRFAAKMLADLGPSARPAVPWLVQATRNSDYASHVAAVRALQKIAPEALAEVWPATIDLRAANVPVASRQEELATLWADLANPDAPRAYRAVWSLALCPQEGVALRKERLHPARPADQEKIARLIADLDSDDFRIRNQATDELQKVGDLAEEAMKRALAARPSLEVCRRLERLLAKIPLVRLRARHAVEALERAGTADAWKWLAALAEGAPEACLTREAKAALKRLAQTRT